jgi:hypothetical protein
LDLDGAQLDYAASEPGLLRYEIGHENTFIPDGGKGVADPDFPQQLWPYRTDRIEADGPPTAGVWRRHQSIYAAPNASTTASGWQCIAAGKPGTWVEIPSLSATIGTSRLSSVREGANQRPSDVQADTFPAGTEPAPEYMANGKRRVPGGGGQQLVGSLMRLATLKEAGALTDSEFVRAKAVVLTKHEQQ